MTIVIHDDLYYVAFRGTDDSLAGWEEDFKACYTMPVEAQVEAESYLGRILMIMMVNIYRRAFQGRKPCSICGND